MNMTIIEALREIGAELDRARELHSAWPTDQIHAAAIVCEESGELIRAAVNHKYQRGLHKVEALRAIAQKLTEDEMRKEAIHTAATAIRFLVGG